MVERGKRSVEERQTGQTTGCEKQAGLWERGKWESRRDGSESAKESHGREQEKWRRDTDRGCVCVRVM